MHDQPSEQFMSVRDAITMRQDSHYIVSKIKQEPLDAFGNLCLCAVHFSPYIFHKQPKLARINALLS